MDWRALLQHQWFQLCLFVAVLSVGTLGYDISTGRFPVPGPTPPVPGRPPAPPVVKQLKAKARGQWIVDAKGAKGSDSRDLREVVGNLADGDTVTVRPGSYEGGFEVTKNVRFVGQGDVLIHSAVRDTIIVSGKRAVFEHFTIGFEVSSGTLFAVRAVRGGHVELAGCVVGSKGEFAAYAYDTSSIEARDSKFQTVGNGAAIHYHDNARGRLERCEISTNKWGLEVNVAAQVTLLGCTFQNNGLPVGDGNVVNISGAQAQATAAACTFTNNTAALYVDQGGTLILNGCTFRNNGVPGEANKNSGGLINVQTGGKLTLNNATLESNRQGIVALSGSTVQIVQAKITGTGVQTDVAILRAYSKAVYAVGPGTTISISDSTISDSLSDGISAFTGVSLTMRDTTVTGSGGDGITVGDTDNPPAHAELTRAHLLNNHTDGVWVHSGSSLVAQDCEFSDNTASAVELTDQNSQGRLTRSTCRNNQGTALFSHDGAFLAASGCTVENSARGAQAGLGDKADSRATMDMENCTVRSNSVCGVVACQNSVVTFRGGFLSDNKQNVSMETGGVVRQSR